MACLVESGMMDGLDVGERREMQRQIQSLILATDIARQQEFLQALKVRAFLLFLSSLRSSFVFCCRCGYRAVFRVFAATPSAPKKRLALQLYLVRPVPYECFSVVIMFYLHWLDFTEF